MGTHDDSELERWVDDQLATLPADPGREPDTQRALAQLKTRAASARRRPAGSWLMAAAAALLLAVIVFPVERASRDEPDDVDRRDPQAASDRFGGGGIPPWTTDLSAPRRGQEVGSGISLSARRRASTPRFTPAAERVAAPGFTLPVADGGRATLADYAGHVLLLNFWATWCGPCRVEMPWFVDFHAMFAERGFAVLGVSVDEAGWDVVQPFLEQEPVNYRIALADNADRLAPFGSVTVLPTTWLIDRHGRLAATHIGLVDRIALEGEILQLLAE